MKCHFCGKGNTQVIESRVVEEGRAVRRRRECDKCEKRFTSYEKVKDSILWVIKKDLRREPFDREKVKRGVFRSVEKRPVPIEDVEELIAGVEGEMLKKEKEEVSSKTIGKAVLRRLKKLDKVAWLRYASVYLEFDDLKDFEKAMK